MLSARRGVFALPVLIALALAAGCSANGNKGKNEGPAVADLRMSDLPVRFNNPVLTGTFTQQVDHSATGAALGSFQQRYWYSTEFATAPDSPVILDICGEAECSEWELRAMADVARSLHASVVALEHRYYGESLPFQDLSLANMKYLTIHNALEDMAAFEVYAKANLPLGGKWIAVGGSYAGMLAAFYRQKHPDLVVGAWASSAPVNVQKSFWGYDALASRALGPTCLLLVHQMMDAAGKTFDDEQKRNALSNTLWGENWEADWGGRDDFITAVSDETAGAAQYGEQGRLCQALVQHADDPLAGMVAYLQPPLTPDDPTDAGPVVNDDAGADPDAGAPVQNTSDGGTPAPRPLRATAVSDRPATMTLGPGVSRWWLRRFGPDATGDFRNAQWYYQVCSEVGFYQVANPDRTQSIFVSSDDEASNDAQCDEFVQMRPDVVTTRAEYYDPIAAGQISNVFWVNGSLDPWSALSFTDPEKAPGDTSVFIVQQGSHCTDLDNLQPNSPIPVFEAHLKFNELAKAWLAQ